MDAQEADWRQEDLFGGMEEGAAPEPVLMALHAEYYELIWERLKVHEFRKRFLEGRPVRWFVYLNAPVSRLAPVIDLGPAVVDTPEAIAAIAERARPGNGTSVLEYVKDLERRLNQVTPWAHGALDPHPCGGRGSPGTGPLTTSSKRWTCEPPAVIPECCSGLGAPFGDEATWTRLSGRAVRRRASGRS